MNPKPFLNELTGKPVMVKLKWGMEYKGEERGWVYIRILRWVCRGRRLSSIRHCLVAVRASFACQQLGLRRKQGLSCKSYAWKVGSYV